MSMMVHHQPGKSTSRKSIARKSYSQLSTVDDRSASTRDKNILNYIMFGAVSSGPES